MGKELEALNKIQHDFGQLKGQELVSCYETIFNALKRLEAIDNANPSEALRELNIIRHLEIGFDKNGKPITLNDTNGLSIIKNALLKTQVEHKALEIIKKHFIIKISEETELNGNIWGRLVSIQSKEDEGTWDTTACANLVDYKEEYETIKEVLEC